MEPVRDIYPSRTGECEKILNRMDPVVYGDSTSAPEFGLKQNQIEFYEDNGYLTIPDFMPEVVPDLIAEMDRMKEDLAGDETLVTEPDSGEIRTIFKPFAHSDVVDQLSRDPRILDKVRQLLGSEVYMMQSRINVKPAFKGKSFPWHSDFETWHVEDGMPRMRAVTVWLMLSENTEYNGPLFVVPGSHKKYVACSGKTIEKNYETSLKKQVLGVPKPETMKEVLANSDIKGLYGGPGTLVFHECNLLHGSPDNISADPRSILMFVYNSVENRPVEPFGGQPPRPHYLSNPDVAPLKPIKLS
ncbi:phytanoyl-CoA dioxygenase family protein [Allohahella marinimesophila]|uniref:Ectoine hydroxylase n=1 Tax=Allohahella marinimesophila TaxID=1054972 RepID=A0ABP7PJ38_9GAMM